MKTLEYLKKIEEIEKNIEKLSNEKNALNKIASDKKLLNIDLGTFKKQLIKDYGSTDISVDFHFFTAINSRESFKSLLKQNGPFVVKIKIVLKNYFKSN